MEQVLIRKAIPRSGGEVNFLFFFLTNLFLFLIFKNKKGLTFLLMDELSRAVAPFYRGGGGGMPGGSGTPPPGPSDNWGLSSASIAGGGEHEQRGSPSLSEQFPFLRMPTPEFQEMMMDDLPPTNAYQGVEASTSNPVRPLPYDLVDDFDPQDPDYIEVVRVNDACLIEQRRIAKKAHRLLKRRGISLEDPRDVDLAVDFALTNEWDVDCEEKLERFRSLRERLGGCSDLWREILKELRDLGNMQVPDPSKIRRRGRRKRGS